MGTKRVVVAIFLCFSFSLGIIPVQAQDNPWSIMINIPEYRLYLYYNDWLFKTFKVAVGKISSPSPTGDFQIINKVVDPTWYPEGKPAIPPGPDNPLGKYWMGLNSKGYGIHGNSAAWSIGSPSSKGCFRMDNHEIEELFSFIPVGTPVKITYLPVKGRIDHSNQAWLEIYPDIYRRINLESKVQQVLAELNWDYESHSKALASLIIAKKPLVIMVPKKIIFEGDCSNTDIDGFIWNGQVYLNEGFFKNNNLSIALPDDDLFRGYFPWDPFSTLEGERQRLKWDQKDNTLSINSLKIIINGEKIDGVGRFGVRGQILFNVSKISNWFDQKNLPKPVLIIDKTEESQLFGEFIDGELWVDFDRLIIKSQAYSYQWDEATWSLKINYISD